MVGKSTQFTSFEDILIFDAKVAALFDESDVKGVIEKMCNLRGKTIVEDKQVVDRPSKVQKVHLASSTSEPVLHFTT
ncbi:hypothetical protein Hanom_Chr05g00410941 [Helianthus anomalus]